MTTTFSIKSVLAGSSLLVLSAISSTAGAIVYPVTTTSTSCTLAMRLAGSCSIEVEGVLRGLGNTTQTQTAFSASILIQAGQIVFTNPAGKSSTAEGVPFVNIAVELSGSDLIEAAQITRNGRALSDVTFHEDALIKAIIDGLTAGCADPNNPDRQQHCDSLAQIQSAIDQHPNWVRWAVVTKLQVLGQQWTESSTCSITTAVSTGDFTGCTLEDALGNQCEAPATVKANPQLFAGKAFTYSCTEVCHNKTGPACDGSLPLP